MTPHELEGFRLDDAAFRRLAELAPDPMLAHQAGRVVWANQAAASLMGFARAEEAFGLPVLGFVAPESRELATQRMRRMLETGLPEPIMEERLQRPGGGQLFEAEVAAAPVGGGVILVVFRDIGPRKRAERQREEALRRWRTFFEATSDAIGVSRRGVHVEANAAYAGLFGYRRPEDLPGVPVLDLIAPADRPSVLESIRRRASGEPVPEVYSAHGLRRDGSEFLMEVRVSILPEGGRDQTVAMIRDVTAQREHEARLAASEARHRELLDQVPVGVWEEDLSGAKRILDGLRAAGVTDLAGHLQAHPEVVAACAREVRILDVNATTLSMLGARDKADLLANLQRVFLPESMEDFGLGLLQLATGRREALTEGWNGTLDGRRLWVAVRSVVAAGHDDWSRVLVSTVDITERRQAREERALLQERLRHAEKLEAVGRLAGGVAHDFNNILSAVLGFAEVSLEATAPGSELHENQQRIREAALRARDLVRQILTFGKRDRPEQRPVDVAAVVGEALALARAGIPAGVAVEARLDPATGTTLADPSQVHQIVLNLCSNARDAVGSRGRIEVTVEPVTVTRAEGDLAAGDWIRLRVRDDGTGMDEATRARLFEPYMTTKGRSGGHGLGLAVVHGIVTGCGGAVRVESAPGLGSTFDVWLPRLAAAARPAASTSGPPARGSARILLVDDEPLVRGAHRRVLQSLGYHVTEAADGAEALEWLRAAPGDFDLVLTDQTMPRLSGAELARAVLAERPGARIILCTGYSDAVNEARARELGLRALLPKPIDRATLAAAVQRALADAPT